MVINLLKIPDYQLLFPLRQPSQDPEENLTDKEHCFSN